MEGWKGRGGRGQEDGALGGEKKETRCGERAARHLNDQPVIAKGFFFFPFITSKGMQRDKKKVGSHCSVPKPTAFKAIIIPCGRRYIMGFWFPCWLKGGDFGEICVYFSSSNECLSLNVCHKQRMIIVAPPFGS